MDVVVAQPEWLESVANFFYEDGVLQKLLPPAIAQALLFGTGGLWATESPASFTLLVTVSSAGLEALMQIIRSMSPMNRFADRLVAYEPDSAWALGAAAIQREDKRYGVEASLYEQAYDYVLQLLDKLPDRSALRLQISSAGELSAESSLDQVLDRQIGSLVSVASDSSRENDLVVSGAGRRLLNLALLQLQVLRTVAASGADAPRVLPIETLLGAEMHHALNFTRTAVVKMYTGAAGGGQLTLAPLTTPDVSAPELVAVALAIGAEPTDELLAGLCWMSEIDLLTQIWKQNQSAVTEQQLPHTNSFLPRAALLRIHARSRQYAQEQAEVLQCVRVLSALADRGPTPEVRALPMSQYFGSARQLKQIGLSPNDTLAVNFQRQHPAEALLTLVQDVALGGDAAVMNRTITKSAEPYPQDFLEWWGSAEFTLKRLLNLRSDVADAVTQAAHRAWVDLTQWFYSTVVAGAVSVAGAAGLTAFFATGSVDTKVLLAWAAVKDTILLVKFVFPLLTKTVRLGLQVRRWIAGAPDYLADAVEEWWADPASTAQYTKRVADCLTRLVESTARRLWLRVLGRPISAEQRAMYGVIMQRALFVARQSWDPLDIVPTSVRRVLALAGLAHKREAEDEASATQRLVKRLATITSGVISVHGAVYERLGKFLLSRAKLLNTSDRSNALLALVVLLSDT